MSMWVCRGEEVQQAFFPSVPTPELSWIGGLLVVSQSPRPLLALWVSCRVTNHPSLPRTVLVLSGNTQYMPLEHLLYNRHYAKDYMYYLI